MTKLFFIMIALCVIAIIFQLIGCNLIANIIYIGLAICVTAITVKSIFNLFKIKKNEQRKK